MISDIDKYSDNPTPEVKPPLAKNDGHQAIKTTLTTDL